MEGAKTRNAERYTTDILKLPGVAFDVTVLDPKERIQVYVDSYRKDDRSPQQVFRTNSALLAGLNWLLSTMKPRLTEYLLILGI